MRRKSLNELIKYWAPDSNKDIVNVKILHIRNLHQRIILDSNLQSIYTFLSWVKVIVRFVPLMTQVVEIHITTWQYSNII